MNEEFLKRNLEQRRYEEAFRQLRVSGSGIDFCSNDYLGIATRHLLTTDTALPHGSTGSRLISGNDSRTEHLEELLADFHQAPAALIFNSGYDANLGLLSAVPGRGDTILFDKLSHASIRDGIRLSTAGAYAFAHNNTIDLEKKLKLASGNIFVVTESVFSMDGDMAPLAEISRLCDLYNANLIVDEAHATGVIGAKGEGLVQELGLAQKCFARVHTFGKAVGCHGAVVLGSAVLKDYLVNFSRPFIYTTALPPLAIQSIADAYALFPQMQPERFRLDQLITFFRAHTGNLQLCESRTPIQGIIIPGNEKVKSAATRLQQKGFDVRPILYPTVPRGTERLRIVLHAFNTEEQLEGLVASARIH